MLNSEQTNIFDVIIVGGGAAGLTAALYASRRALKTLVISQDIGGQASTTDEIENYPGVELISGPDLMNKFKSQAAKFGTEFNFAEVTKISKQNDEQGKPLFTVSTNTANFVGYSLILAFGLTHRHLNVPGEEKLGGRGVAYCATCDAPFYKNKTTVVVGGGNSAVSAALLLSNIAKKVYLVHWKENFNAEAVLVEQLKDKGVELVLNNQVQEIKGDTKVVSIIVAAAATPQETREILTDGVFIEVGYVVNSKLVEGLVELDECKQIKITRDGATSQPGIFAAGDVTDISYKQVVISAGWGATAALKANEYLQKNRGIRSANIDWGIKGSK
jgi:thioredoxin reductase (NADPH)